MADAPSHSLLSRLIAETFGTFMLVFGVIGAALFISGTTGPLGPVLAIGFAVLIAVYAVGHISGGHFNPSISVGAAAAGRLAWKDVLPYIGSQLVGGILATVILWLISATSGKFTADFGAVSNGFGDHSPGGFGLVSVIITEIVITCLFVWVVLGVTAPGAPAGFAPLCIGLALSLFLLISIPIDNASLNPARSIATAIFGGGTALSQLWVFIVAPLVGGVIAGFSWKALFGRAK